ncbi:MAG: heavy metal-associated domain-containing protein [Arenibacter latericius]|nr:heavy metal-associated domain-containing protein [Arenibacter latericius]
MESTITVQNIKCGGCASTITSKLSELEDITDVSVDVVSGTVSFETTNKDGIQELKNKLKSLGYPAADEKNGLDQKAKSFVSCATGRFK